MKFRTVMNEIEDWEKIKNHNDYTNVIIFKYSPYCSVSRSIEREISKWAVKIKDSSSMIFTEIDVVSSRNVSQAVAADLGIKHESPQVIILDKDGKVIWHESHYFISIDKIEKHLSGYYLQNETDEKASGN